MPDWVRSIPRDQRWGGCRNCIHDRRDGTCVAYPVQIPIPIASGEVDHLVVRPGQVSDTVFERRVDESRPDGAVPARSGRVI
jgi:hypothetical protein